MRVAEDSKNVESNRNLSGESRRNPEIAELRADFALLCYFKKVRK